MPRESPGPEDWAAVGDAIRKRMRELKMSTAQLARETGLSETTIRYIGEPTSRRNKSSLVAISAVLRWRYDHLINILRGEPEKNVIIRRPAEVNLERLLRAEVSPMRQELAELASIISNMGQKIDALFQERNPNPDHGESALQRRRRSRAASGECRRA